MNFWIKILITVVIIFFIVKIGSIPTDKKEVQEIKEIKETRTNVIIEKPTKEPTIKPTATRINTKTKKKIKTMADIARKKLQGKANKPYIKIIEIISNIDITLDPSKEEKTEINSNYEYVAVQTFIFSDGSKIRLTKYQKNGMLYLMAVLPE